MTKITQEEKMLRLAEIVANSIIIPEHCTLEWDDIYQEVCLLYLERGYTQNPGALRVRVTAAMNRYVEDYGCEIACGILEDVIEYNYEKYDVLSAISAVAETHIIETITTLTPREQTIINFRFGLEDGNERTRDEVAKHFNVQRERIRQIEAKALRKCRHPSRARRFADDQDMINAIRETF